MLVVGRSNGAIPAFALCRELRQKPEVTSICLLLCSGAPEQSQLDIAKGKEGWPADAVVLTVGSAEKYFGRSAGLKKAAVGAHPPTLVEFNGEHLGEDQHTMCTALWRLSENLRA